MSKYFISLFCLILTCCSSGKVRDLPALDGSRKDDTFIYGHGKFQYGARFILEFENVESGKKKAYKKGWNVFPGFTPDDRSLLFAFAMPPGGWVLKTIQVTNGPANPWNLPVTVNIPFEVVEGKGNFIGEISGTTQGAEYTFQIATSDEKKAEVDGMMAKENPAFNSGKTLAMNLPNKGPFK